MLLKDLKQRIQSGEEVSDEELQTAWEEVVKLLDNFAVTPQELVQLQVALGRDDDVALSTVQSLFVLSEMVTNPGLAAELMEKVNVVSEGRVLSYLLLMARQAISESDYDPEDERL